MEGPVDVAAEVVPVDPGSLPPPCRLLWLWERMASMAARPVPLVMVSYDAPGAGDEPEPLASLLRPDSPDSWSSKRPEVWTRAFVWAALVYAAYWNQVFHIFNYA